MLIIDVEGAELDVLESGKEFLSADTEVLVEVSLVEHIPTSNVVNPNFLKTFEFMKSYKYSSYTWIKDLSILNNDKILAIANGKIIPSIQMYYFKK